VCVCVCVAIVTPNQFLINCIVPFNSNFFATLASQYEVRLIQLKLDDFKKIELKRTIKESHLVSLILNDIKYCGSK